MYEPHKTDLYCKCKKFTNKNDVKVKIQIDGKINLYFYRIHLKKAVTKNPRATKTKEE